MDNEVAAARAKLAARFGKTQMGGKGKLPLATINPRFNEL